MDVTRPQSPTGGDRLSKLEDRALSHILSFLPVKEAGRAALLSSRWRGIFAAVHTVSLEEPVEPVKDYDDRYDADSWNRGPPPDPNAPPPFPCAVSNILLARHRRGGGAPLRALRVQVEDGYKAFAWGAHNSAVDQWVTYAVEQAAPEGLRLDIRLCRALLCGRPYSLIRNRSGDQNPDADEEDQHNMSTANESETESRSPPPRRRPSPDMGFEWFDDEEPHPRMRRRSISSNEGSSDSDGDYDGNRALSLSLRQRLASYDRLPSSALSSSSDDTVFLPSPRGHGEEEEEEPAAHPNRVLRTVPALLFSCAALRSLSLGHFRLAPPMKVNLPSLETLLLSQVSDPSCVEQIIAGSPHLADLTLEACIGVVSLYVPSGARLRRLVLRCCHNLATVDVDASELVAFEYRGAVPNDTFLTMHGGAPKVVYCKIDICGQEVSSEEEATKLAQLVQLFANAKRLHLESARLGSGMDKGVPMNFPALSGLRHLELRGRLPDDDTVVDVAAVSRILDHAPYLEALSLIFHPEPHDRWADCSYIHKYNEEELLDAQHLKYNGHSVLVAEPSSMLIPCLRSSVREINLVHYQGGRAQRALAKFLLCNAPVMETLWCEFAEGPLWTQTQLMREIKGWVVNESAKTHFV